MTRAISDAEIVTLCIAQAIMGLPSDQRFLLVAARRLRHLFPPLPTRDAFHKRGPSSSAPAMPVAPVASRAHVGAGVGGRAR